MAAIGNRTRRCRNRKARIALATRASLSCGENLELVPEELVIDLVMELHFRNFDERAQQPRAAVRRTLLEICVPALDVFAEQFGSPGRLVEVVESVVDVVRQVPLGGPQICDLGDVAVDAGL